MGGIFTSYKTDSDGRRWLRRTLDTTQWLQIFSTAPSSYSPSTLDLSSSNLAFLSKDFARGVDRILGGGIGYEVDGKMREEDGMVGIGKGSSVKLDGVVK